MCSVEDRVPVSKKPELRWSRLPRPFWYLGLFVVNFLPLFIPTRHQVGAVVVSLIASVVLIAVVGTVDFVHQRRQTR